jgi:hypothetical protein
MTSINEAFPLNTWDHEYKAEQDRKAQEEEKRKEELLEQTFGVKMSEMKPRYSSVVRTNDGSIHYIHAATGVKYKYVYAFGKPYWKMDSKDLGEKFVPHN